MDSRENIEYFVDRFYERLLALEPLLDPEGDYEQFGSGVLVGGRGGQPPSEEGMKKMMAEADARSRGMGINGVPFFIFNQKVAVSGAQDPANLLAAMQQAVQAA